MTPARFRRIALGLKDAVEHAHHGHPDFRVGGRIFATLGYPDKKWGMVVLSPDQSRGGHAPVTIVWEVRTSRLVQR